MSNLALAALQPSQQALVTALNLEFAVRERLAALGVRVGRPLQVVRRIGASGPMQVRIGHTDFILRRSEADRIEVRLLPGDGDTRLPPAGTPRTGIRAT